MTRSGWWWHRAAAAYSFVFLFFVVPNARAQSGTSQSDSLKSYQLSEIVVGGEASQEELNRQIFRVGLADLVRLDVSTVAGALRLAPATHLQTNSRGETLAYIRGHGERQIALFLDGAPLNIPWDNRIDLGMVPSMILGEVSVYRGAVSAAWGPNVSGGVLNLKSRSLERQGHHTEALVKLGTQRTVDVGAMHLHNRGRVSLVVAGNLESSDGYPVPDEADLPYSQAGQVRTNTDREGNNVFARIGFEGGASAWGLSFLHANASKGVAPESHLDPGTESVRFWRYPLWQNTMGILNGRSSVGPATLSATVWSSLFRQRISDFHESDYERTQASQEDEDRTTGARLIAGTNLGAMDIRVMGNVLTSRHNQHDYEADGGTEVLVFDEAFRSVLYSTGIESEYLSGSAIHFLVGASMDGQTYPDTGDKPARDGIQAWTMNTSISGEMGFGGRWKISGGRKVRFPTMRELFGAALGTFIVNPDLRPETTWIGEGSFSGEGASFSGEVVAFAYRTTDAIDQKNVIVDGTRFRRRINLEGSRVVGLELLGAVRPKSTLELNGHLTWMRPVGIEDGETIHLVEKPEVLSTFTAVYSGIRNVTLSSTGIFTGKAYGRGPDNTLVDLASSFVWNVRVSARTYHGPSRLFLELFAGVDNVLDEVTLPQLGLPGPGRTARVGLSLAF